ncbi:MAG: hypothetical protein ACJA0T_001856 [Colwellia sp.]|jgi:hypothetical protein
MYLNFWHNSSITLLNFRFIAVAGHENKIIKTKTLEEMARI